MSSVEKNRLRSKRVKNIARFLLLVSSLFIFTQNISANEQQDLKKHLLTKIDEVIVIVQDKALSKRKETMTLLMY